MSEALLDEQGESIEKSLWESVRGREENASLLEHVGRHLREHGQNAIADEYVSRAKKTWARTHALRRTIEQTVEAERGRTKQGSPPTRPAG